MIIHRYTKEESNNIYFSSDFHAYQANICKGLSKWVDKDSACRDFDTIEEMTNTIIKSINDTVGRKSILYHLGDWSFGGWENIWNFRKQIKCENIFNIDGNHDYHIRKNKFFPHLENRDGMIFEIKDENDFIDKNDINNPRRVNASDFFVETYCGTGKDGVDIEIDGQLIVLNHYPLKTWNGIENGSIHLHGHEHSRFIALETGKWLDLDWNRFKRPISFSEVMEILNGREIVLEGNNRSH